MGAPGTETPTQKRPRTYSRHGLNTLRRALTTSVPGGEAGGKSHPLTRGGAASSENGAFVYAQTPLHVVETTTVRWWSFRLSAPGEIEAANGPYRGKKATVLVGLGGYQMFDSLALDRDGHICFVRSSAAWQRHLARRQKPRPSIDRELLTLRSEQWAAPAERPSP